MYTNSINWFEVLQTNGCRLTTARRAVIEMIEELAMIGGGYGLFTGCSAGDTAASLIIKVG